MAYTAPELMFGFEPEQWEDVADTLGFDLPLADQKFKFTKCGRFTYEGMDDDFTDLFRDVVHTHVPSVNWSRKGSYGLISGRASQRSDFTAYPFGVTVGQENGLLNAHPPDALMGFLIDLKIPNSGTAFNRIELDSTVRQIMDDIETRASKEVHSILDEAAFFTIGVFN